MPLPFIPVVVALGAVAAGGTIAGALGVRDKKKSNELNKMAQLTVSNAEELLKNARETTQDTLGKLGKIKLKLWSSQVNEFINYYSLINNVNQEFSENKSNVAFGLSEDEFRNISRTASSFSEIAGMGLTTLGTGALAGLGAFSGVMLFGTASTGTAISTLTGIAATNATLAWLGGGTLAAGGLGIAGGIAILGGIVAAPIFAIGGTLFAISAKNNLRQAEQNIEKANDIKSEMQDAIERLNEITETADLYYLFLSKMDRYGDQAVKIIQQIIKKHGVDFSVYSRSEQTKLQYACNIMRLLTEALNTAIMTEKGILDAGSLEKFTSLNGQSVTLQEQFHVIYKPSEKELDLLRDQFESLTERYDLGIIGSFDDMRTARIWRNIYSRISNGDVREDDKPVLAIITQFIEYLDWKEFLTA